MPLHIYNENNNLLCGLSRFFIAKCLSLLNRSTEFSGGISRVLQALCLSLIIANAKVCDSLIIVIASDTA